MSTLRGGAALNQNQIAKLLGFDRTVVHRAIKTMIREGLLAQKKAATGRALPVQLTAKGNKYRDNLVKERRNAEENLRKALQPQEIATLIRLLNQIAEFKF
jgi:DNA-binding MarR family transcriptional regulator